MTIISSCPLNMIVMEQTLVWGQHFFASRLCRMAQQKKHVITIVGKFFSRPSNLYFFHSCLAFAAERCSLADVMKVASSSFVSFTADNVTRASPLPVDHLPLYLQARCHD